MINRTARPGQVGTNSSREPMPGCPVRIEVFFSTIETKLFIDTRVLVTLVSVRPNAVGIMAPSLA
jgi:hypothetical protein